MPKNDNIKPHAEGSDKQVGEQDNPPEDIGCLSELLRWEQNDKARNLIESGDMGSSTESLNLLSQAGRGGEHDSIFRGAIGETEQERYAHLRHSQQSDEAAYPEIYPRKSGVAKHKRGYEQVADNSQTYITKKQFINLHSAVSFANHLGVALNAHITIHWQRLGYPDHSKAAKALTDGFFKPLDEWYENHNKAELGIRHPHPFYWIYVHECSPRSGFHSHILASIPLEMREEFKVWAERRVNNLSKIKQPPKEVLNIECPPSDPIGRQWIRFQYLCKGLDPKATVEIAGYKQPVPLSDLIKFRYESPGRIQCKKRVGTSVNIAAAARVRAEFTSDSEKGIFDKRHLYSSMPYDLWHENKAAQAANEAVRSRRYIFETSESIFPKSDK